MNEQLVKVLVQLLLHDLSALFEQPRVVVGVGETIVVDAEDLVTPEALHGARLLQRLGQRQQNAGDDARKVAQVEEIVRLGRCRQQVDHGRLVDGQCAEDDLVDAALEVAREAPDNTTTELVTQIFHLCSKERLERAGDRAE